MKGRIEVYLTAETETALREYARHHRGQYPSVSRAAAHLIGRALAAGLDEGMDALLAPTILRAVRETTRREIADGIRPLLERQSGRLAGLLVASGKDAHRAARIAEVALGHLLADPARAARVAEEAALQAGARYRPGGLSGEGHEGESNTRPASRPPGWRE